MSATVISADDHLVERPGVSVDRVPSRLRERAPRVITTPEGTEPWGPEPAGAGAG